jgi:hypothetical protein
MKPTLLLVGLLAAAVLTASAQDAKPLAPRTIREAVAVPGATATPAVMAPSGQPKTPPANLFFCPPGKCLYYAGDLDCNNPNMNALFDFDNPGIGISDAEVWVGVKPTKDAMITGASGNYFTNTTGIGINPIPFAVRTGIAPGKGGKIVCSTHGNALFQFYGDSCGLAINAVNYLVSRLAKACRVKAGKTYYIDLTPQYNDSSTVGYLQDDDGRHLNRRGWPEMFDDSYFNSSSFGVEYEPTWGNSGACGGIGCDGFSISLTGTKN